MSQKEESQENDHFKTGESFYYENKENLKKTLKNIAENRAITSCLIYSRNEKKQKACKEGVLHARTKDKDD